MVEKISLEDFIKDLKQNIKDLNRSDLQGIIEARCIKTGEDDEEILQIIDEYIREETKNVKRNKRFCKRSK